VQIGCSNVAKIVVDLETEIENGGIQVAAAQVAPEEAVPQYDADGNVIPGSELPHQGHL
jgi:hypothetical protein